MGTPLAQLGSAIALGVALAAGPSPALAEVTGKTQERTGILLAQAGAEKQEYVVYVRQVDTNGNLTDKTVEVKYTKEDGTIIPPLVTNGKLLDWSPASGNINKDERANRKIIGQYDKDKQIVLAAIDKGDILWKANLTLNSFIKKVEKWDQISITDLSEAYTSLFISKNLTESQLTKVNTEKISKMFQSLDAIGEKILKLRTSEIENIKTKSKEEAQRRWQSVTRSLG